MTAQANFHSLLVGWLKILFPLAALALLSTLFLFARDSRNATSDIPFAEIGKLAAEQRIGAPRFTGITRTGDMIEISATSAKPQDGEMQSIAIASPRLALDGTDGSTLRIRAGAGIIDTATSTAKLSGLARLETSTGYIMESAGMTAHLDTGIITSDGALEVQAPYGSLTAGQMTANIGADGTARTVDFTQGVKLIYVPPTAEKGTEQ